MATTFLEPGGDATFNVATTTNGGFWDSIGDGPTIATDFVHGAHIKSIRIRPSKIDRVTKNTVLQDSGARISFYLYIVALPNAVATLFSANTSGGTIVFQLRITTAGVLQLWRNNAQIGIDGSTLSTGTWYRLSIAYTITSTFVNRFEIFKDGNSDISVTNATLNSTSTSNALFGISGVDTLFDARISDHYIDNSSSLTDTGNIWVTAKRPNANGTNNNFLTQIGSGGSGYGTGHSPQVNERALSTTNGWSTVASGTSDIEEYTIESASTGDINISTATIVDFVGWLYANASTSVTANIVLNNNASTSISLTTTNTMFTKVAGSTTYPAGNTDIGIKGAISASATQSLYECGIMFAFIPTATTTSTSSSSSVSTSSSSSSSQSSSSSSSSIVFEDIGVMFNYYKKQGFQ